MKKQKGSLSRLLGYLWRGYKWRLLVVLLCIFISTLASVAASLFLETLIDDYISPLLLQAAPVFTGLLQALLTMAVIYLAGIRCLAAL